MKRAPYTYGVSPGGKRHWRSLEEFADTPAFREALAREFPEGASEIDEPTRRGFLQVMGASVALAGLAGCRRPEEKILPFARAPEQVVPGRAQHYATAFSLMGTSFGLVVESHEGRPTKVEGNPRHPDSLGAATIYGQAEVLSLYDPDRSDSPAEKGQRKTWDEAAAALRARVAASRGVAVLTTEHRSPSLAAQLEALRKALPGATVHRYEPLTRQRVRAGARLALGRYLEPTYDVGKARVVLALDSDLLHSEGSSIKHARGFADGRRLEKEGDGMNRLYSVESGFTPTGSSADHRLRIASRDVAQFALALAQALVAAHHLDLGGLDAASLTPRRKPAAAGFDKFVATVAKDLVESRGASLVVAGHRQPEGVHALVLAINAGLGNLGRTVHLVRPFSSDPQGPEAIAALSAAIKAGSVDTLLILGGNPVLDAPADADFAAAVAKAPFSAHLSSHLDETSAACTWHLPRAHFLEAWGDTVSEDGTLSIVQPLIAPLLEGKSDIEVVELAIGGTRKGYDIVRAVTTAAHPSALFEGEWRRALHDGVWAGTAWGDESAAVSPASLGPAVRGLGDGAATGYEVTFAPDSHAWDGRYANNGWLQEMPDPITKLSWDNAALVGVETAKKLGVVDGDLIKVTVNGRPPVELPARIAPGTADDTIQLTIGQGRKLAGKVALGAGFDCYPLRTAAGWGFAGATAEKTGGTYKLAETQEHFSLEGRPIVRETDLVRFRDKEKFAEVMQNEHPPLLSLFNPWPYEGHKWGMVIDLNACIGCNACMVGCQAENNIPLVGKAGVLKSREMHWIRLDRYYTGDNENDPQAVMQPMTCQQCENAPCEQVCPVGATTHSPEGLNDMAYNRCIGTRYCANNCPYKVRRFNFFNYQKNFETISELRKLQYNPDVTVRSRGVMEKCTYCVQRINETKIAYKREAQDFIPDGKIVTACQQACPMGSIVFGDLNDKDSAVTKLHADPRSYKLLEEVNVRPRVAYLAKIRNLNPELEKA